MDHMASQCFRGRASNPRMSSASRGLPESVAHIVKTNEERECVYVSPEIDNAVKSNSDVQRSVTIDPLFFMGKVPEGRSNSGRKEGQLARKTVECISACVARWGTALGRPFIVLAPAQQ